MSNLDVLGTKKNILGYSYRLNNNKKIQWYDIILMRLDLFHMSLRLYSAEEVHRKSEEVIHVGDAVVTFKPNMAVPLWPGDRRDRRAVNRMGFSNESSKGVLLRGWASYLFGRKELLLSSFRFFSPFYWCREMCFVEFSAAFLCSLLLSGFCYGCLWHVLVPRQGLQLSTPQISKYHRGFCASLSVSLHYITKNVSQMHNQKIKGTIKLRAQQMTKFRGSYSEDAKSMVMWGILSAHSSGASFATEVSDLRRFQRLQDLWERWANCIQGALCHRKEEAPRPAEPSPKWRNG